MFSNFKVYKSTGDVKSAQEMFNKYSEVSDDGIYPWARWRSIILAHKQPRKIMVQHNTRLNGKSTFPPVVLKIILT